MTIKCPTVPQPEKAKISKSHHEQLACWERFYRENFDIHIDINNIKIPEYELGFNWIIVVAKGVTIMMLLNLLRRKNIPIWLRSEKAEKNLDALIKHDRDANDGTYAVTVQDLFSPELTIERLRKLETQNGAKKIATITLLECILLDVRIHLKNKGRLLNYPGVTLCTGSRYVEKEKRDIPAIYTAGNNNCLYIYGFDREYSNPCVRLVKIAK